MSDRGKAPVALRGHVVRVRRLVKEYRSGRITVPALRGVHLDVAAGSFTAIVGPSGCGKSTLLHVLGGMLRATAGSVLVDDFDVTGSGDAALTEYRRTSVGFVFQRFNLLGSLTVRENLRIACRIAGRGDACDRRIAALLERVGLAAKARARPAELSQGEQQRVAIARALAKQPKLLLADEPTGNLDSANSRAIMALFREIAADHGPTILMITHNPECARVTDATIEMEDGKALAPLAAGRATVGAAAREGGDVG